jgi:hypothetical protein
LESSSRRRREHQRYTPKDPARTCQIAPERAHKYCRETSACGYAVGGERRPRQSGNSSAQISELKTPYRKMRVSAYLVPSWITGGGLRTAAEFHHRRRFGMKRNFPKFIAKHHGGVFGRESPGALKVQENAGIWANTMLYRRIPNRRSHHVAPTPHHVTNQKDRIMTTLSTRGESVFKRPERLIWTFHPLSTSIPRNPGLSELMRGVDAASHIKRRPPDVALRGSENLSAVV